MSPEVTDERFERFREWHKNKTRDGSSLAMRDVAMKGVRVDRENRLIDAIITTPSIDTDGEVVMASKFDTSYFGGPKSPIKAVYFDHAYSIWGKVAAIGAYRSMEFQDDGTVRAITYVKRGEWGDEILEAVECEAVGGTSLGFKFPPDQPRKMTPEEEKRYGAKAPVYDVGQWLEYSLTSMPANQEALIQAVRSAKVSRAAAVRLGLPDTPARVIWPTSGETAPVQLRKAAPVVFPAGSVV